MNVTSFGDLTPLHPNQRLRLESADDDLSPCGSWTW